MKLQFRILLIILLSTVLPTVAMVTGIANKQWEQDSRAEQEGYRIMLANASPTIADTLWNIDEAGLMQVVQPLFRAKAVERIQVFDDVGKFYLGMERGADGKPLRLQTPVVFGPPANLLSPTGVLLLEEFRGHDEETPRIVPLRDESMRFLLPLSQRESTSGEMRPAGYVVIDFTLAELHRRFRQFFSMVLAGGSATVLLSIGLLFWFFRSQAVMPVARLSLASRQIAQGDFDRPVPVGGRDEVGVLAESFEHMRLRIKDYTQSLIEKNEEIARTSGQLLEQKQRALDMERDYTNKLEADVRECTAELLATQQKLVASEKMAALGVFTAGMAHEINNPANFISASVQNATAQVDRLRAFVGDLLDEEADPEISRGFEDHFQRLDEFNTVITEGVQRIGKVIRGLRSAYPEGETGIMPHDLSSLVESAWDVVRGPLGFPVRFEANLGSLPPVPCVAAEVHQVLIALFTNAVHAIEDVVGNVGDSVDIGVTALVRVDGEATGDTVTLRVKDSGAGIPESIRERIFDPFFTTKTVGRGSGLGLSMARDILTRHGGSLVLGESEAGGACLVLGLPLQPVST